MNKIKNYLADIAHYSPQLALCILSRNPNEEYAQVVLRRKDVQDHVDSLCFDEKFRFAKKVNLRLFWNLVLSNKIFTPVQAFSIAERIVGVEGVQVKGQENFFENGDLESVLRITIRYDVGENYVYILLCRKDFKERISLIETEEIFEMAILINSPVFWAYISNLSHVSEYIHDTSIEYLLPIALESGSTYLLKIIGAHCEFSISRFIEIASRKDSPVDIDTLSILLVECLEPSTDFRDLLNAVSDCDCSGPLRTAIVRSNFFKEYFQKLDILDVCELICDVPLNADYLASLRLDDLVEHITGLSKNQAKVILGDMASAELFNAVALKESRVLV